MKPGTCAALLLATPLAAQAAFLDGNRLLELMNGDAADRNIVQGYVAGVADQMQEAGLLCLPPKFKTGELRDLLRQFIDERPGSRDLSAPALAFGAWMPKYLCRK